MKILKLNKTEILKGGDNMGWKYDDLISIFDSTSELSDERFLQLRHTYKVMNRDREKRFDLLLSEVRNKFQDTQFDIGEEPRSIQLYYNNRLYNHDDEFFDVVCDIAAKYLTEDESYQFCILQQDFGVCEG